MPSHRKAIARYRESVPALERSVEDFVRLVRGLLDEAGINYLTVSGRTKTVESFAGKVQRRAATGTPFEDPLAEITDQVGVRVITYVESDVLAVAELLADQLSVLDDRDLGQETAVAGRFGYASRHILVSRDAGEDVRYEPSRCASVQLRTVLQHAWAEFEHDIRYKGSVPDHLAAELDRRFTLAAGLIELADDQFSLIRDRLQETLSPAVDEDETPDDPRLGAPELTAFLAGRYSTAGWSRTDRYEWISGVLLELGITSLDELSELLQQVDSAEVTERMGYRYPPGAVRRLDDDLLHHFGAGYVELHTNAHRREALAGRLERLRRTPGGDVPQ